MAQKQTCEVVTPEVLRIFPDKHLLNRNINKLLVSLKVKCSGYDAFVLRMQPLHKDPFEVLLCKRIQNALYSILHLASRCYHPMTIATLFQRQYLTVKLLLSYGHIATLLQRCIALGVTRFLLTICHNKPNVVPSSRSAYNKQRI